GIVTRDRRGGQSRELRVCGILDEGTAASLLDGARAGNAVVSCAGEDDADRPRAEGCGGATEEHVDGGPEAVCVRAAVGCHGRSVDHEMVSRARDVDAPRLEVHGPSDLHGVKRAYAGDDVSKATLRVGAQMEDDA